MTAGHIGMVAIFGLPLLMMRGGFSEGIGLSVGGVAILLNTAIFLFRNDSMHGASLCILAFISGFHRHGNPCGTLINRRQ